MKTGSNEVKYVWDGTTRVKTIKDGSGRLVYPFGRSHYVSGVLTGYGSGFMGWATTPVYTTGAEYYSPAYSYRERPPINDGADMVGATVYNDMYQWTLAKAQTGTWRFIVTGDYRTDSASNAGSVVPALVDIGGSGTSPADSVNMSTNVILSGTTTYTPFYASYDFVKNSASTFNQYFCLLSLLTAGGVRPPSLRNLVYTLRKIA